MADYGVARPEELAETVALCAACIRVAPPEYFHARLTADPTRIATWVARDAGRVVASVTAHAFTLRIGGAEIPAGGIANVVTAEAHRGRGHARALMALAHQEFTARSFPVAILSSGIPGFYRPLGYEIWEREEARLLTLAAPSTLPAGAKVRPINPARDLEALSALHAAHDRTFAGPLVRAAIQWTAQAGWTRGYPGEDPALSLLVEGEDGRPAAYIRGAVDTHVGWLRVLEWAARPGAPISPLATEFVRAAVARGARGIGCPSPCRDLIAAIAPYAAVTVAEPADAMMVRLIDLPALLEAVAPGLTARVGDARAALTPAQWVEVVMGVTPFSGQPFAARSRIGEKDLAALDAALPRRPSVFWDADSF